jgi:hypothetical protein
MAEGVRAEVGPAGVWVGGVRLVGVEPDPWLTARQARRSVAALAARFGGGSPAFLNALSRFVMVHGGPAGHDAARALALAAAARPGDN